MHDVYIFNIFVFVIGSPIPTVVGFIDGTLKPIIRPVRDQKYLYNGKEVSIHGLIIIICVLNLYFFLIIEAPWLEISGYHHARRYHVKFAWHLRWINS